MTQASLKRFQALRFRGHSGQVIKRHRALRIIKFTTDSWLHAILLPIFFSMLLWLFIQPILFIWGKVFQFWLTMMNLDGKLATLDKTLATDFVYKVPYPALDAGPPALGIWTATAIGICILMLFSYLALRRIFLPAAYFMWVICLIQATALFFFQIYPDGFIHSIPTHVSSGLEMSLIIMFLIPWILAFSYYPFEFSLTSKIAATSLMIFMVALFTPFQYMMHGWLIHKFSLLFMPLAFIVFGAFLNIIIFISLYAWAMSWKR